MKDEKEQNFHLFFKLPDDIVSNIVKFMGKDEKLNYSNIPNKEIAFLKQQAGKIQKSNVHYIAYGQSAGRGPSASSAGYSVLGMNIFRIEENLAVIFSPSNLIAHAAEQKNSLIKFRDREIPILIAHRTAFIQQMGHDVRYYMKDEDRAKSSHDYYQPVVEKLNASIKQLDEVIAATQQRFQTPLEDHKAGPK